MGLGFANSRFSSITQMVLGRPNLQAIGMTASRSSRGFSLVDILVTIAIIALLMGILLPSLAAVNETARRVACKSNVRQVGLGLISFADDNAGYLPVSVYLPDSLRNQTFSSRSAAVAAPQNMLTLRVPPNQKLWENPWDGLGLLFSGGYLLAPKIFYCPSHRGENPYSRFAPVWDWPDVEILGNYHYRGFGPNGTTQSATNPMPFTRNMDQIIPRQTALVADGMQIRSDNNHKVGVNVFRADLSVDWFADSTGRLARLLPDSRANATSIGVEEAWNLFDIPNSAQ